ncbi:hypothetical protein DRQ25_04675 [Candidatus Fermentibacteria bacterium]|nr:MAG: hypothetical protein DRQ25_04675 [Candidatus Fermentibacteria bacterium]
MRKGQKHTKETREKISKTVRRGIREGTIPLAPTIFKKGHATWNKNLKGIHLSPGSEFKKGETAMEKNPNWKGGVQKHAKDCTYLTTETNKRVRRPRKIYEELHGRIPEGCVIFHLDGDRYNDDPSNLVCVTRAELIQLNRRVRK